MEPEMKRYGSFLFGSGKSDAESGENIEISPDSLSENVELQSESENSLMSPVAQERRRAVDGIRQDLSYFDDQLTKNEIFAVKTRENLRKIEDLLHRSEIDLEEITTLKSDLSSQSKQLKSATEQVSDLSIQLADTNTKLRAEAERVDELRGSLESTRLENTELTEQLSNERNRTRTLSKQVSQLESLSSRLEAKLVDLKSENHVFNETIERQNAEIAQVSAEHREMDKRVAEIEKMNGLLQNERDKLSATLNDRQERIANLTSERLALQSSNESLKVEMNSKERHAADKLRGRDDEIFTLKSEIDTLNSQLNVRKQMFAQAQQDMNSAKAMAKVAKDSLAEMEERLVQNNLATEQDRRKLLDANDETSQLNARYTALLKEFDQVKRENASLRRIQQYHEEQSRFVSEIDVTGSGKEPVSAQEKNEPAPVPKSDSTH